MEKRALRDVVAAQVRALPPEYCQMADMAICRLLLASDLYQAAHTVFCYVGTEREINTRPILQAALAEDKILAIPLCVGPGRMEARRIRDLPDLIPGRYNIPAPSPNCPAVDPGEIDLAIVPCATGNLRGQRLGYGGGYYDRFLPQIHCPTILLCRARLLHEDIPTAPHDCTMNFIATENGIQAAVPG